MSSTTTWKKKVTIDERDFQLMILHDFRYSLDREFTSATIWCARRIGIYWKEICPAFQEQIQRDAKQAIERKEIKKQDSIEAWEKILKLEIINDRK